MGSFFKNQGSSFIAGVNTQTPDDGMLPSLEKHRLDGDTLSVTGSLLSYESVLGLPDRMKA